MITRRTGFRRFNRNVRRLSRRAIDLSVILLLSAARPVFTTDLYVIDGGSGKTRAVADHNDLAHWLDQADTTKQCDLPAPHPNYAGKLCLNFTGTQWYVSNRTPTYWALAHNAGGNGMVLSISPTAFDAANIYAATHPVAASTTIGAAVFANGNQGRWLIGNGTAAVVNVTMGTTFALNTPVYLDVSYVEGGGSPEWEFRRRSSVLASGDSAATPTASAPPASFTWGAGTTNLFPAKALMRHVFCYAPTIAAHESIQQYLYDDSRMAA